MSENEQWKRIDLTQDLGEHDIRRPSTYHLSDTSRIALLDGAVRDVGDLENVVPRALRRAGIPAFYSEQGSSASLANGLE